MSNDTEEKTSQNNLEADENNDDQTSKKDDSAEQEVIDYKAELERERKAREKAESDRDNYKKGMLKAKSKKKKDEWDDDFEDEEDDQEDVINRKVEELVSKKSEDIYKKLSQNQVNDRLDKYASSEDEKELMRFHLEHTINPSGDLDKDVQDAKLIANRKSLLTENQELKAALRAKGSIRNSSMGTEVKTNQATKDDKEMKKLRDEAYYSGDLRKWGEVISKRLNK